MRRETARKSQRIGATGHPLRLCFYGVCDPLLRTERASMAICCEGGDGDVYGSVNLSLGDPVENVGSRSGKRWVIQWKRLGDARVEMVEVKCLQQRG